MYAACLRVEEVERRGAQLQQPLHHRALEPAALGGARERHARELGRVTWCGWGEGEVRVRVRVGVRVR